MNRLRLPRRGPVALAALLALHGAAVALPGDARTTFGQVGISRPDATTLLVQQSTPRAGIDWQRFSIDRGETVRFAMPDRRSVVVNRVTGQDPSVLLGRMEANGRVFLVNPRGVVFGAGAQVDVGALVATSLSLSPADAAAGRWRFSDAGAGGAGGAGAVRNEGTIVAREGTVVLAGPQVSNSGRIDAARIGLAAAGAVTVDLDGDGLIVFASRPADAARLDQLGTLDAGGGRVELRASARGALAQTVLNVRGAVMARSLSLQGGEVVVDGGRSGITEVNGTVDASGARGGGITVVGEWVGLGADARLDASGRDGGGRIEVGGGLRGAALAQTERGTAARTSVAGGAVLDASAVAAGDGGRVIVWSDEATRFHGRIAARGGAQGGDGGFAEVSGKGFLDWQGQADLGATVGRAGALLLDPTNLTIQAGPPDVNGDGTTGDDLASGTLSFNAPGANSLITGAAVVTQLAAGAVVLQANDTITVNAAINSASANGLTLAAGNNINVNAAVTLANAPLTLSSNDPGSSTRVATGRVQISGTVNTGSGALTITNNGGTGQHLVAGALGTGPAVLAGDTLLSGALSGRDVTVAAGRLTLGAPSVLDAAVTVNNGASVDLAGNSQSIGTLTLTGGDVIDSLGSGALSASAFGLQAGNVSATLAGPGALTKTGAGTVTLSGANSYAGTTQVDAGTLRLGGSAALPAGSALNVNGGTLDIAGQPVTSNTAQLDAGSIVDSVGGGSLAANTLTLGGGTVSAVLAGTGGVTKVGAGTATLAAANTYAGATTVSAGTLVLDNGAAAGSGAITVAGGSTLQLGDGIALANPIALSGTIANLTGTATLSGVVTLTADSTIAPVGTLVLGAGVAGGSTVLTKAGTGLLRMTTGSSYGGGTVVTAGVLQLDGANATPGTGDVTLAAGATLQLDNGANLTVPLSSSGTVILNSGNSTLSGNVTLAGPTVLNANGGSTLTLSAAVDGPSSLTTGGPGVVVLNGTASFAGALTATAGTLRVNGLLYDGLSVPGDVVVRSGATLDLDSNPNALTIGQLTVDGGGALALGSGGLAVAGGSIGGSISSSGAVRPLTLERGGTLTLQFGAQVDADLTVSDGTLALEANDVLTTRSNLTLLDNGSATVDGDQFLATLIVDGGSFGGSGTLTATSYQLGDVNGFGTSIGNLGSGNTGSQGAMSFSGDIGLASFTVNNPVTFVNGRDITTSTQFTGSNGLTVDGSGVVTFTANNNYGGGTTIRAGRQLRIGNGGSGGTLGTGAVANQGLLVFDRSSDFAVGNDIGGSGTVRQAGTGVLSLTGTNTYTGDTEVLAGTLAIAGATPLGNSSRLVLDGGRLRADASLTVATPVTLGFGNGTVDTNGNSLTLSAPITGAGALVKAGTGELVLGSTGNAYQGGTRIDTGSLRTTAADVLPNTGTLALGAGTTLTLGGNDTVGSLDLGAGTLAGTGFTLTAADGRYLLGGGTVNADLGFGTLTQTASSTLNGRSAASTVAIDIGTLTLGAPGRLTGNAALTMAGGTSLVLGGAESLGSLAGAGSVSLGSATLTTGGNGASTTFAGGINGNGALVKTGTGNFTLAGANGYTGGTTVQAGTLTASGAAASAGSGAIVVSGAGTLAADSGAALGNAITLDGGALVSNAGSGRLGGVVTLSADSTVGGSGTLTVGNRIDGNFALSKQGGGTAVFTEAGSYSGGTVVNDGVLALAGGAGRAGSGAIAVQSAGTLDLRNGADVVANGALSLDGGTLASSAGNGTAGAVTLASDSTLRAGTASTLTIGGALGGSGGFDKTGSGLLVLSTPSSYGGATVVSDGTLRLAAANVLPSSTTLSLAAPATLDIGAFDQRVTAMTLGGTVLGSGLLSAPNTTLSGGTINTRLGDGALQVTGSTTLNNTAASTEVTVSGGTLSLTAANLLTGVPALVVGNGATLLMTGGETVGAITLQGGSLRSTGATDALVGTRLDSSGTSTLDTATVLGALTVDGTLSVTGAAGRLGGAPAVTIANGATLSLSASETVGAVDNRGTLVAPASLQAASIAGAGALRFDGSVRTTGGLSVGGPLTVLTPTAAHTLSAGGDLVAEQADNDLGSGVLSIEAASARLRSRGAALNLGSVALAGGASRLESAGTMDLGGDLSLGGGTLALVALGARSTTGVDPVPGSLVLLPKPGQGEAGNRLQYALPTVTQSGGAITTAADSGLTVLAPNGGSVLLARDDNRIAGGLTARAGAGGDFVYTSGAPESDTSVSLADRVLVHNSVPLTIAAANGERGVDADVVQLRAPGISTAAGAAIHVRLPFAGAGAALPGLTLDLRPLQAGNAAAFGSELLPITVTHGRLFDFLLRVEPDQLSLLPQSLGVYLACQGTSCAPRPAYEGGGVSGAVPVFYNGVQITDAPPRNSAISSNTSLLEGARRTLFEEAVRTENVAPRLRAGVIAEVGAGRPATEGSGGLKRPPGCDPKAGSLECAP